MIHLDDLPTNAAKQAEEAKARNRVPTADWAIAILLTTLVGLSTAALLGATFLELIFDKTSAWMRIAILLPLLLISSYLLMQKWRKLFNRHDDAKK